LDSVRRDAEFACVFASVAFLTVSFVPKSIFWNPAGKSKKVRASKTGHKVLLNLCRQERIGNQDDLFQSTLRKTLSQHENLALFEDLQSVPLASRKKDVGGNNQKE